jgi:hypothetical protein
LRHYFLCEIYTRSKNVAWCESSASRRTRCLKSGRVGGEAATAEAGQLTSTDIRVATYVTPAVPAIEAAKIAAAALALKVSIANPQYCLYPEVGTGTDVEKCSIAASCDARLSASTAISVARICAVTAKVAWICWSCTAVA